ncbi:MAG: DUF2332 domain-containing protein [Thermoleophilaceae bacterium]|nr:DUF2332 domain-containing protein [Thermoleophilaceae bacterium]
MTARASEPKRDSKAGAGAHQVADRLRSKRWPIHARGGSPLYAHLLEYAARDAEAGGPSFEVLREHADEPFGSALALRFLAAVHRLVLEGKAPPLARHYPSTGGDAGLDGAWPTFRAVLEEHCDRLRELVARPCQTNEVGRCASLLPGFLAVASEYRLPLRILELGSSAGLNLNWDRYRYEGDGWEWGPEDSAVRISGAFEGGPAPGMEMVVIERRGCDSAPLDPVDPETRLALRSSVWADHLQRLEFLDAALDVAREHPPAVDRADVCEWLEAKLSQRTDAVATVVFHSILWQYLDDPRRERLRALLGAAGSEATERSPLAWLRMEPPGELASVTLTTWPGDHERLVALSGYRGRPVRTLSLHADA